MAQPQSDDTLFAQAIEVANIPTLLMVLVQLTGDERWLEAPYRPTRLRVSSNPLSGETGAGSVPSAKLNQSVSCANDVPVL